MRYIMAGAGLAGLTAMTIAIAQDNSAGITIGAVIAAFVFGWFVREAEVRR